MQLSGLHPYLSTMRVKRSEGKTFSFFLTSVHKNFKLYPHVQLLKVVYICRYMVFGLVLYLSNVGRELSRGRWGRVNGIGKLLLVVGLKVVIPNRST